MHLAESIGKALDHLVRNQRRFEFAIALQPPKGVINQLDEVGVYTLVANRELLEDLSETLVVLFSRLPGEHAVNLEKATNGRSRPKPFTKPHRRSLSYVLQSN